MIGDVHRSTGMLPFKSRRNYSSYKSPYGPKYTVQPNIAGWTIKSAMKLGITLGAFGGVAGFTAIYFLSDVPRFRKDLLQKVPFIGQHFIREIPPSDNSSDGTIRSPLLDHEANRARYKYLGEFSLPYMNDSVVQRTGRQIVGADAWRTSSD